MKAIKKLALLLIALLVITPIVPAQAGTVEKETSLLVDGQLNSTDWFDAEDSTYVEEGKLILPADGFRSTRVISKNIAQEDSVYETMFTITYQAQITELPENEKFIFAIGLDSIEAISEEPENIEIEITNDGSLKMGVVCYDENGNANTLAAPKNVGIQLGDTFTMTVTAFTQRKLLILVNGATAFDLTDLTALTGRIGFLKTGKCGVSISECITNFTHYDRPENPNFTEDFETEVYNNNLFTMNFITGARFPASIAVQEYKDSSVLMFYNAKLGYWGTKYSYSNFELTFDVPFYLRNMVKDEKGNMTASPTMEFVVSVGDDAQDFNGFGYATSVEAIRFTKDTVHGMNHSPEKFRANYGDKGYFDIASDEGFSVLVRMVDGHLEVGMKALDAEKYDILGEGDYEDFRTGFVKIWSVNDGNFAIDNVKMTNLDVDGKVIDVEFKGATIVQEDFDYQRGEPVFRPVEQTQPEEETNWMPVIITSVISASLVLVSVIVALCLKKKRQKEDVNNEIQ